MFFTLLFNFWYRCLLDCLEMNQHLRISRNWNLYWSIIIIFLSVETRPGHDNFYHEDYLKYLTQYIYGRIAKTWDHHYVFILYCIRPWWADLFLKFKPCIYMQICKLTQNPTILVDIFILDILLTRYCFEIHITCRV